MTKLLETKVMIGCHMDGVRFLTLWVSWSCMSGVGIINR